MRGCSPTITVGFVTTLAPPHSRQAQEHPSPTASIPHRPCTKTRRCLVFLEENHCSQMSLNKPVSAVPQVVNAFPAETYLGLYLRSLPFPRILAELEPRLISFS